MSTPTISPPAADASLSSGPSPTSSRPLSTFPPVATLHLIGAGKVGRAFLRRFADPAARLVAASDRTATVFERAGLGAAALADWKALGLPFADHARAAPLPLDLALSVADAAIVIDATDSDLAPAARRAALDRTRALLRRGKQLLLAAKTPLLLPARELAEHRAQLGVNAVFGGTGRALLRDLGRFEAAVASPGATPRALVAVPNATTTHALVALERGATLADGLGRARAAGLLEADPTQDLDGRDAALKLALATRLAFGIDIEPESIERPRLDDLDPWLLRERARRGATTRLVGRIERDGAITLRYEEIARGSPLAVPPERVAWTWQLADGSTRAHLGDGLGAEGTARALLDDLGDRLVQLGAKPAARANRRIAA